MVSSEGCFVIVTNQDEISSSGGSWLLPIFLLSFGIFFSRVIRGAEQMIVVDGSRRVLVTLGL